MAEDYIPRRREDIEEPGRASYRRLQRRDLGTVRTVSTWHSKVTGWKEFTRQEGGEVAGGTGREYEIPRYKLSTEGAVLSVTRGRGPRSKEMQSIRSGNEGQGEGEQRRDRKEDADSAHPLPFPPFSPLASSRFCFYFGTATDSPPPPLFSTSVLASWFLCSDQPRNIQQ